MAPGANLSEGLGWLQTTCSIRFNRRHRRSGHLFQGWFKAHPGRGGQRMTQLARPYGYRDGSGIHRVVKRLESRAKSDPDMASKLKRWRARLSSVKS